MRVRSLRAWQPLVMAAAVLSFPVSAHAQEADETSAEDADASDADADDLGDDEVTLKNGGTVRGTIVSYEPGQDVVIKVYGKKKPRTIGWAEVADVERGKYAAKPDDEEDDPAPGEAGPGFSEDEPREAPEEIPIDTNEPGVVKVHIESDDPEVALLEIVGGGTITGHNFEVDFALGQVLCRTPCDQVIDARDGRPLFFAGDGVTESEPFSLRGKQGDVTINVEAGSAAAKSAGRVLLYGGIPLAISGGVGLGTGFALSDGGGTSPVVIVGAVGLGVGVAAIATAIPLILTSDTEYEIAKGGPQMVGANPLHWVW